MAHSLQQRLLTVSLTNSYKKYFKYGYLLLVIPVFFILRYYYINDPAISQEGTVFAVCPFHYVTGLHCPGCGSQRAIHDILHIRILDAIKHNVLLILVIFILFNKAYALLTKKYAPQYFYDLNGKSWFTYSIVIIVLGYWILRNIPVHPFTHLAP